MERRRESRVAGSGIVHIAIAGPAPLTVHAALIESSASGFRASHDSQALEPGLAVDFTRNGLSGRARVIWTHILDGRRTSGFLVL
jgi:hypothetical protein